MSNPDHFAPLVPPQHFAANMPMPMATSYHLSVMTPSNYSAMTAPTQSSATVQPNQPAMVHSHNLPTLPTQGPFESQIRTIYPQCTTIAEVAHAAKILHNQKQLLALINARNISLSPFSRTDVLRNPNHPNTNPRRLIQLLRKPLHARTYPSYHALTVPVLRAEIKRRRLGVLARKRKHELVHMLITADSTTSFRFLDLPLELRRMVYAFVLEEEMPLTAVVPETVAQPALLKVCRVVRTEACPVFYAVNRVAMSLEMRLVAGAPGEGMKQIVAVKEETERWLDAIGQRNVAAVRVVVVELAVKMRRIAIEVHMGRMKGVQHLRFYRTCAHHEVGKAGCARWLGSRSFEEVLALPGAETLMERREVLEQVVRECWTDAEEGQRDANGLGELAMWIGQSLFKLRKVIG